MESLAAKAQAVFRSRCNTSTRPSICRNVKYFEQLPQSQKFSIALLGWGKPKNLPPSRRIRVLEHCGLAHFEIIPGLNSWLQCLLRV
jgi:hypothetical protein